MLMQKEMTYLWAETARNSSHTDLGHNTHLYGSCLLPNLRQSNMHWYKVYLVLSVRPMAIPSNTACREMAKTTRKPRRAAWTRYSVYITL